jgi:hypothetical protein
MSREKQKGGKQKHMHSTASFIPIVLATKHYFTDLIQSQSLWGVPFHTNIALDLELLISSSLGKRSSKRSRAC